MTLAAAMMKSRISMVAPGRPMLKNLGLQCLMMVFTMSCKQRARARTCQCHATPPGCQTLACGLNLGRSDIEFGL